MNYDQFWYGEPRLVIAYREAHKLKIEEKNQELWLQGLYIYNAFGVIIGNVFSRKGSTPQKYIDKPLSLFPKEVTEAEKVAQRNKVIMALTMFKDQWDKANGNKGK